jgi:hypothetical protein
VELRQGGGVAEDCRGHVLRQGKADAGHAAGGGRQEILGIAAIPLPPRNLALRRYNQPQDNGPKTEPVWHDILLRQFGF